MVQPNKYPQPPDWLTTHYKTQTGLKLPSLLPPLPSAEIRDVRHHAWLLTGISLVLHL